MFFFFLAMLNVHAQKLGYGSQVLSAVARPIGIGYFYYL